VSGSLDVHAAVVAAWNLDTPFQVYWPAGSIGAFPVLHDTEAGPAQPMPYCIFGFQATNVIGRMSGTDTNRRELRNVPLSFSIHTRTFSGVSKSAKKVAGELVNLVMALYGGHPSIVPAELVLDMGGVLQLQYQNDYGGRTGDDEYSWMINYLVQVDVPVAL